MIVRWSFSDLDDVLDELGVELPFLVASRRWKLDRHVAGRLDQVPSPRVDVPHAADSVLALGGGSAIDTAKLASAQAGLPLVSVPTTYSGAEWTTGYGIRTPDRRMVGGGGGAHPAAIVYDVELTLGLPRAETVGTAMNALAHCAEALYVRTRNDEADAHALAGAAAIAEALPEVVERPDDADARRRLLEGACHAGQALALAGAGVAHAVAQALGGRYGLPHGAMNALSLPPALDFARGQAPEAVERFERALGGRSLRELAALGGFGRLADVGVPEGDLPEVAALAAGRGGNRAMPRPASQEELEALLRAAC